LRQFEVYIFALRYLNLSTKHDFPLQVHIYIERSGRLAHTSKFRAWTCRQWC